MSADWVQKKNYFKLKQHSDCTEKVEELLVENKYCGLFGGGVWRYWLDAEWQFDFSPLGMVSL